MNESLGHLGAFLGVAGALPYVAGNMRGRVRPHLFTWLVWALVAAVNAAGQIGEAAEPGAWITRGGIQGASVLAERPKCIVSSDDPPKQCSQQDALVLREGRHHTVLRGLRERSQA